MTMNAHVRVGLDNLQEHASTFESVPAPVAADGGASLYGSPVVAIEQRDAAVCSAPFEHWVAQTAARLYCRVGLEIAYSAPAARPCALVW